MDDLTKYRMPDIVGHMQRQRAEDEERQAKNAGRFDAEDIFRHLLRRVQDFQEKLDENEELGLQLANFGLASAIHIRQTAYRNPNLIEFSGVDLEENEVVLVQHISQLNFMLRAVKPLDQEEPFRMGF